MNWLMLGKIALIAFLVLGCSVLVITYMRKSRGVPPRSTNPYASPYLDLMHGGVPPTPLPQWVESAEACDGDSGGDQHPLREEGGSPPPDPGR
jgi:hypothetical protein